VRRGLLLWAALSTATATADPRLPHLRLGITKHRMPTRLSMRFSGVVIGATPAATSTTNPPAPPTQRSTPRRRPRPVTSPVTASAPARLTGQLSLGLAVDGANLGQASDMTSATTIGGSMYQGATDYANARAYGFGDAIIGGRGLLIPGLSGYLASRFQIEPAVTVQPPIESAWDRRTPLQIRAGWTEANGVIESGPLATLRIRGGRQYVYGPAVAHLDGLWGAWNNRRVRLSAYLGSRVPDWNRDGLRSDRPLITGAELSVTLRRGRSPATLQVRSLGFAGHSHSDATIDWSLRRDLGLVATARFADQQLAHERITARYRWSDETRVVLDADLRQRADWLWDYELRGDGTPAQTRPYLDLGPRRPGVRLRARAGTVLLENIDVLLFGALAINPRTRDPEPSYTNAGWIEGGSAVEIQVRRTFAVTASGLTRIYNRRDAAPQALVIDREDEIQALALDPAIVGERSLVEAGFGARFQGGAHTFSAAAEFYARRTRYGEQYRNDTTTGPAIEAVAALTPATIRGGGRFTLEGWVSPKLRVRIEYDLSSRFESAPEIDGMKSLRLLVAGTY
jgi:hypothetical protein